MACCIVAAFIIHRMMRATDILSIQQPNSKHAASDASGREECEKIFIDEEEVVTQHLSLSGLTCNVCCTAIEDVVRQLPGVVKITTSLLLSSATVVYKRRVLGLSRLKQVIRDAGYGVSLQQDDAEILTTLSRTTELEQLKVAFRGAAILSAIAWASNYATALLQCVMNVESSSSGMYLLLSLLPAWFVQTWYARSIHIEAWWKGDKTRMDTLLSTSILLGLETSFFDFTFGAGSLMVQKHGDFSLHTSNALLVTVVLGGRYLNQALRSKATSEISALHSLRGATSHVTVLHGEARVPVFLLQAGDKILIPADSVIPCDCYITSGASSVDQSLMTGESAVQTRRVGDLLMSGTTNLSHSLEAIVTQPPETSSLSRLVESVRAASASSDNFTADSLPGYTLIIEYFASAVMAIAFASFIATGASSLMAYHDSTMAWQAATRRAMLILSVACPCSLGLATPAATMAGINAALRRGVLVKGGLDTFSKLATLTHMAFDKTGTLTRSGIEVSNASFSPGIEPQEIYLLICAAERREHTRHIVGRAVFRWAFSQLDQARKRQFQADTTEEGRVVEGKGVLAKVTISRDEESCTEVLVGSSRLLREMGVPIQSPGLSTLPKSTQLEVYVSINRNHVGTLTLENVVRPNAQRTANRLRDLGLDVSLITGDNAQEAQRVADLVGIARDHVTAQALPWDKASRISELQSSGASVAMVGDGMNDLPAQSTADLSVIVCGGSESSGLGAGLGFSAPSDLTLLPRADLDGLYEATRIARKVMRQARMNLGWALAYNVVALLAATGCLDWTGIRLDVSMTGMMMAMSSVCVLLLSQLVHY